MLLPGMTRLVKNVSAILVLLSPLLFGTASAQSLASCLYAGQDADGDGFGWVADPEATEQPHSCIVDETTQAAPVLVNQETNTPVQLVRAYWDANRDLTGRTLECEEYLWSNENNLYELQTSYQRYHHSLPDQKPWIGVWNKSNVNELWTVVDGVLDDRLTLYASANRLSSHSYWVELISLNGGVDNATRWWENEFKYHQCSDPATNRFIPTGTPGTSTASPSPVSTESLIFTTTPEPQPTNLYTYENGSEVILSRGAAWDIQDLAYKTIRCDRYTITTSGDNTRWRYDDYSDFAFMFLPPTTSTPRSGFVASVNTHWGATWARASTWTIENDNTLSGGPTIFQQDWFELTEDVLRYWEGDYAISTCWPEDSQMDTAYTRRATTMEEYDAFVIKTNIDSSHCTTPENQYDLNLGARSCLVESDSNDASSNITPADEGTQGVTGSEEVQVNETGTDANGSGEQTGNTDDGSDAAETISTGDNNASNEQPGGAADNGASDSGGGSADWFLLLLLTCFPARRNRVLHRLIVN